MTIVEQLRSTGIRRLGTTARGFRYRTATGRPVTPAERERIGALRIPPGWTDVAIHASPTGTVQAVGRDRAGRWQYRYHDAQAVRRERTKQARLLRFLEALPRMRRAVARDLALPGIPRAKVLAAVLRILGTCFLRPGSEEYADQNGSYGIATLRRRHVTVRGDRIRFDFEGKSRKRQSRELRDRRIARLVRDLVRYPGEVFKFRAEDGSIVDVRRGHINAYMREVMGAPFSAKDFRTWAGSLLCACALARQGAVPRTPGERRRRVAEALREVAVQLGNTPAVCRSSYVFPAVIRRFQEGYVIREAAVDGVALANGHPTRVERSERALANLLRREARGRGQGGADAARPRTNGTTRRLRRRLPLAWLPYAKKGGNGTRWRDRGAQCGRASDHRPR